MAPGERWPCTAGGADCEAAPSPATWPQTASGRSPWSQEAIKHTATCCSVILSTPGTAGPRRFHRQWQNGNPPDSGVKGVQTVDLEGLACHKGSSFGAIGCDSQPTTEQFENNLYEAFRKLNPAQPVWLEDESHNIGGVNLPVGLWQHMQKSPTLFIRIPREVRAGGLVGEYTGFGTALLEEATRRIARRLGGENSIKALGFIAAGHFREAALILLAYYDKSYTRALQLHTRGEITEIQAETVDPEKNATIILEYEERRRTH